MIEIGLCADENFAMPCGVCITSIFESNKDSKIRVHILTDGFTQKNIEKFEQTAERYNQIIEIYNIDSSMLEGLYTHGRLSIMTYARLLFSKVLDPYIQKLLYIDCDIVVLRPIDELWNTDITEYACACVPDFNADDIRIWNQIDKYNITYANAGVILMNLVEWRNQDYGRKCIEHSINKPTRFLDQDAINAVLNDRIYILNFRYNLMTVCYYIEQKDLMLHKKYWQELDEAIVNPVMLHFGGYYKPWHKEYSDKKLHHYFTRVYRISEWKDFGFKYKSKGMSQIKYAIIRFVKAVLSK